MPGAISSSMVSSATAVTVACRPEVVITRLPATIEACNSCAFRACFFLLREPKTIITPTAPNIRIKSAKFCMLLLEEIAVAATWQGRAVGYCRSDMGTTELTGADVRTRRQRKAGLLRSLEGGRDHSRAPRCKSAAKSARTGGERMS